MCSPGHYAISEGFSRKRPSVREPESPGVCDVSNRQVCSVWATPDVVAAVERSWWRQASKYRGGGRVTGVLQAKGAERWRGRSVGVSKHERLLAGQINLRTLPAFAPIIVVGGSVVLSAWCVSCCHQQGTRASVTQRVAFPLRQAFRINLRLLYAQQHLATIDPELDEGYCTKDGFVCLRFLVVVFKGNFNLLKYRTQYTNQSRSTWS